MLIYEQLEWHRIIKFHRENKINRRVNAAGHLISTVYLSYYFPYVVEYKLGRTIRSITDGAFTGIVNVYCSFVSVFRSRTFQQPLQEKLKNPLVSNKLPKTVFPNRNISQSTIIICKQFNKQVK